MELDWCSSIIRFVTVHNSIYRALWFRITELHIDGWWLYGQTTGCQFGKYMAPQNNSFLSKAVQFRACAVQCAAQCDVGGICWYTAITKIFYVTSAQNQYQAELLRKNQLLPCHGHNKDLDWIKVTSETRPWIRIVTLQRIWNYDFTTWMWFWRHALAWEHSLVICVACFLCFLCTIILQLHHTQSSINGYIGSRFLSMRSNLHLVPN